MVTSFYRRYSRQVLIAAGLLFPLLFIQAELLPTNNDIETWLPKESEVRATYDEFKSRFGAEEVIVVAIRADENEPKLVEAVCQRLDELPGIRKCWSPTRLQARMQELGVPADEAKSRLKGLAISENGELIGLFALLSKAGLKNRSEVVADVRDELAYCQMTGDEISVAGVPVVMSELKRLGSRETNKQFFIINLAICAGLLYYTLRQWKLTLAIMGLTVWSINGTLALINIFGGEMNFILDALPVMVMVFTLATQIHFLHYYSTSMSTDNPLGNALRLAWKPCLFAALTTTIGLLSLTISDIGPVRQFGFAAALGCVVSLVAGLGITPAILTLIPPVGFREAYSSTVFGKIGTWLADHSRRVAIGVAAVALVTCVGLGRLESKISPHDFLPKDGKVLADIRRIQQDLTNFDSIEAIIDFGPEEIAFVEKLRRARTIEKRIKEHDAIGHTMSLASFFPDPLPSNPLQLMSLLGKAQVQQGNSEYIAGGERYWRISARLRTDSGTSELEAIADLKQLMAGEPVVFTGIDPLLDGAQSEIFDGFWKSLSLAFVIISVVMMIALRSLKLGAVAMIPNLTPIFLVFGMIGWLGISVDIGMMMSGSIALGIAVDGTFHFLVRYNERKKAMATSAEASRFALSHTGPAILQATMIAAVGMLAMTLSSFGPTARFGLLMAIMLMAALVGDLVLLPALLSLRGRVKRIAPPRPNIAMRSRQRSNRRAG